MAHFPFDSSLQVVCASGPCPSAGADRQVSAKTAERGYDTPRCRAPPDLTHVFSVYSLFLLKILHATWVHYCWPQVLTECSGFLTFTSVLSPNLKQIFATNFVNIRTLSTHQFSVFWSPGSTCWPRASWPLLSSLGGLSSLVEAGKNVLLHY